MRKRIPLLAIAVLAIAGLPRGAECARAQVTYLAGGSVYVDAGRLEGVGEGDTLVVLRQGRPLTRIRARYVSSHRAVCDTLSAAEVIHVGDDVSFAARPAGTPAPVETPGRAERPPAPDSALAPSDSVIPAAPAADTLAAPRSRGSVRGRIGLRYLGMQGGSGLSEPALDVRLEGTNVGGLPFDFTGDVRARRAVRPRVNGGRPVGRQTRVYRMSVSLHDAPAHRRVTVGRMSAAPLASVSLFDGVLLEGGGDRIAFGLFGGMQPDPLDLAPSSAVAEHGFFVTLRQRPLAARRWSLGLGGVSAYEHGHWSRDFVIAQAWLQDRRISGSFTQEADLNRGWKRAIGEPAVSVTNTFLVTRVQVTRAMALRAGFDNRRNVRLYRDRTTPETEFDDRYRQGAWGGASAEFYGHLRLDTDFRARAGSASDGSRTWSAGAEAYRLASLHLSLRGRYSSYSSDLSASRLYSLDFGLEPLGGARFEASAGARTTKDRRAGESETFNWQGVDLDLALGLRWYLLGSFERGRGAGGDVFQEQLGLSWRF